MRAKSLFPEVDEEIIEIKAVRAQRIQELKDKSEKYRPSNFSEGEWFEKELCRTCKRYGADFLTAPICRILCEFHLHEMEEVIRFNGEVICLKHSDFDIDKFNKKSIPSDPQKNFETGDLIVFSLNEDGCSGIEVIRRSFNSADEFRVAYANLHNLMNKNAIVAMPHLFFTPARVGTPLDVDIYYQDGEFVANCAGLEISEDAIFIGTYFGVEYG